MTLTEAIDAYLSDCARHNSKSTMNGKRNTRRLLLATLDGAADVRSVTRADMRRWAHGLTGASSTQRVAMKHARTFWHWCIAEELVESSPLKNVAMPKLVREPTQPLSRDEVRALLRAAPEGSSARAMILLMRYTGLAISDAVTLRPDDIRNHSVVTHRNKTGILVAIPLPEVVELAMSELAVLDSGYWFWTGRGERVTAAKIWRERLKKVAEAAHVEGFHPHRLRDTFAVELLLDCVPIEDVAKLLGHSSVTMTERYYAPWNRARLERLEGIVRAAHGRDVVLVELAE